MKKTLTERFSINKIDPEAYKAMSGFTSYLNNSSIKPLHREMIKIRASQINGCAYCIQTHAADARKMGETEQRIYALSAWWESPLFTEQECALLALTDELTLVSEGGVCDDTYDLILKHFSELEATQLIMQVIAINAWNRIAISTHMVHK